MSSSVRDVINIFKKRKTVFNGTVLPPEHMRLCGDDFKDDQYYLDSALAEAKRLQKSFNLNKQSRVLDIGCGPGRLAVGIIKLLGEISYYQGVDVDKKSIKWCNRFIHPNHPNFKFLKINVQNERYNPKGEEFSSEFELPFPDKSFDIIYLYSVFSHLKVNDIITYLKEFKRLLDTGGKIFLTAFIEEDVPEMSINPPGYRRESWKGPLHCVRYNKEYFVSLLKDYGFSLENFEYERETHGQSGLFLTL